MQSVLRVFCNGKVTTFTFLKTSPICVNNHAAPTSLLENIKYDAMLLSQTSEGSSTSGCSNTNTRSNNAHESTPRTITPNPYNDC
ncbi:uncharacterized protein [Eurosta solidaginis]|uniref:uncharacterized protein isoform X2 n=1 Tax=Eurosta solidaginis TaxID=178769 RepID=UPI003530D877